MWNVTLNVKIIDTVRMATAVDKKEDLTTCSICFETFKKPKHFPCLHSFCEGCIQTYITKTFEKGKGGVNCPLCRMFVTKPGDIKVEEWSSKLPTNHILASLIDLNETKSGQKLCAACSRENETESAFSWCAHCSEALCKACDRSHRRSKASSNHKLIELGEGFFKDIPLHHADVFCSEHPEKKVEAYCNDHSTVCCMTCVILKHRKCDNVGSIEDAAEEKKKSREIKEFSKNLQDLKTFLEKLCKNRTENVKTFESDIKKIRGDVETLFQQLSGQLNKLKINVMSEISKVEKELKPEIENEHFEIKCRIPAVENDLSLFETNMKHAPPAQFIQAMEKLKKQTEILEHFVRDQSQNLREIRITFKANEKLLELSRGIQECGEVKVSRIENELQHFVTSKVNMLTAVPGLTSNVNTGFHVRGIALLENGNVVLSNDNNKRIELRDPRCSMVLSILALPGNSWGIKMTSDKEGAVAVERYGLVLFKIQNNQIVKIRELMTGANADFVYHRGLFYVGCNKKITVYDSNCRKVRDISLSTKVSYMCLRGDNSLCYTAFNNTSCEKCFYCVRMDGSSVFTYSHRKLYDASGVTVDHSGHIYVCDNYNGKVHQLSHDGTLQRIIFDNLPARPYCISFNTQGDKVVIGCNGTILMYDMK